MRDNSSFTFFLRRMGTLCGVHRANGFASGLSCIAYLSPLNVARPLKSKGHWSGIGVCSETDCETVSTYVNTFRAWIAGRPNKLCFTFRRTKMTCVHCLSL